MLCHCEIPALFYIIGKCLLGFLDWVSAASRTFARSDYYIWMCVAVTCTPDPSFSSLNNRRLTTGALSVNKWICEKGDTRVRFATTNARATFEDPDTTGLACNCHIPRHNAARFRSESGAWCRAWCRCWR